MLLRAPLVIEAAAQHTASLIFLHGLGDTGYGWAPVMSQLSKTLSFMKFILPHAPQRKVTLNYGMAMPAWYDIYTLGESEEREDEDGVQESTAALLEMVAAEERAGIPRDRIFIGGFSQGAAVSLFTILNHPEVRLGGVLALSGYVPCRRLLRSRSLAPLTSPIFMAHGTADAIVQFRWHQHSVAFVRGLGGVPLTVRVYEGMQHASCGEEIADVSEFIKTQLQRGPGGGGSSVEDSTSPTTTPSSKQEL